MRRRLYSRFMRTYAVNLLLIGMSVAVAAYMIMFLFNMLSIKDYWLDYRYGSLPAYLLLDEQDRSPEAFDALLSEHGIEHAISGRYAPFQDVTMRNAYSDVSLLSQDIFIFGFNFDHTGKLNLSCGGNTYNVDVQEIYSTHATDWRIKTEPVACERGSDVSVQTPEGEMILSMKRSKRRYAMLEFDAKLHDAERFYALMMALVREHIYAYSPSSSGSYVSSNGISEKAMVLTSIHKATMENLFSLIYNRRGGVQMVASMPLHEHISDFSGITQRYVVDLGSATLPVTVLGGMNFSVSEDGDFSGMRKSLFGNLETLSNEIDLVSSFAFVYDETMPEIDGVVSVGKEVLAPEIESFENSITALVGFLVVLIFGFIVIIILVALKRFYTVYAKELYMLKLYGARLYIFTLMLLPAIVLGCLAGVLFFEQSFISINGLFREHYFQVIPYTMAYAVELGIMFILMLALVWWIERLTREKLYVSTKG